MLSSVTLGLCNFQVMHHPVGKYQQTSRSFESKDRITFGNQPPRTSNLQIESVKHLWDANFENQIKPNPVKPEVSVLIPVYNVEPYLKETLQSLQAQTLKNWEAILINDGSTDHSLRIANEIAKNDPRIIVVDGPHTGVAAIARNWMASKAQGRFISQMDSDDAFADSAVLQRQVDYFKAHPETRLVYASAKRIDANGNPLVSPKHDGVLVEGPDGTINIHDDSKSTWKNLLNGSLVTHVQASLIRKEHWIDIPNTQYYEDHLWYVKLASRYGIDSIQMMPFKGFLWRKNPNSLTQDKNQAINDIHSVRLRNKIMFQDTKLPVEYRNPAYMSEASCKRYLRLLNKVHFEHKSWPLVMEVIKAALLDPVVNNTDIFPLIIQPHLEACRTKSYRPNFV